MVKAVIFESKGGWVTPGSGDIFYIDEGAQFPSIQFEIRTESEAEREWSWTLRWSAHAWSPTDKERAKLPLRVFQESGKTTHGQNAWRFDVGRCCLGGTLTVEVQDGTSLFKRSVRILGRNPTKAAVRDFLATTEANPHQQEMLMKIFEQESGTRQFVDEDLETLVAFDKGFGLGQLTNPAPSFAEAWDWKEHVRTCVKKYKANEVAARKYLKQILPPKHDPTDDEVTHETVTRWNGGTYFLKELKDGKLQRNPIICDSTTSNIGWDPTDHNKGKTEAQLHERDKASLGNPSKPHEWRYSGVCYADHVLR
ncbi:MAG: hypothetical protein ACXU8N_15080 [Telluria sp.]